MISSSFESDSTADPYDWDALARYVSGESSPDEASAVRAWLEARPERAQLVTALRQSIDGLALGAVTDIDVDGALRKVHARMAEPVEAAVTPIGTARRPRIDRFAARASPPGVRRWRVIGSLAAAAAVVVTALGIWRSRAATEGQRAQQVTAAMTYATGIGQRDSVRLSDGSRVLLGPSSQLIVAAGFGASRRDVELRGEGYFDVVHDTTRPFTVHAGNASIVDVGTTFSVRGDASGTVQVAVTSGAVRLSRAAARDSGVLLRAGDVGTLGDASAAGIARRPVTGADTAFARGQIVFRDAPLSQVAAEVRRWYGIELRASDSAIARRRLTATFDQGDPAQAMAVIGAALGGTIERRGDTALVRATSHALPNAKRTLSGDSSAAPEP